jgi:hypothetical protein
VYSGPGRHNVRATRAGGEGILASARVGDWSRSFLIALHLIEFGREKRHLSGEIDLRAAGWRRFCGTNRFSRKLAQSDARPILKGKRTMALAMLPLDDRSGGREMLSRAFAVAGALFSLMALITAAVAALGLLGLAGVPVDPSAAGPARMLGLPWSLAITPAVAQTPTVTLSLTCAAMAVNAALLTLASRLVRAR